MVAAAAAALNWLIGPSLIIDHFVIDTPHSNSSAVVW